MPLRARLRLAPNSPCLRFMCCSHRCRAPSIRSDSCRSAQWCLERSSIAAGSGSGKGYHGPRSIVGKRKAAPYRRVAAVQRHRRRQTHRKTCRRPSLHSFPSESRFHRPTALPGLLRGRRVVPGKKVTLRLRQGSIHVVFSAPVRITWLQTTRGARKPVRGGLLWRHLHENSSPQIRCRSTHFVPGDCGRRARLLP